MSNKLWHFGDSFACWLNHSKPELTSQKGFSEYISDYYNVGYRYFGREGYSNDEIFKLMLTNFCKFKENDIILINWSFFERLSYISKYLNNCSTNLLLSSNDYLKHDELTPYNKKYINYILSEKLEFSVLESFDLFKNKIIPFIESLELMGINVISSFNSYNVKCSDSILSENNYIVAHTNSCMVDIDLLLDNKISYIHWRDDFNIDYLQFLNENDLYKDGEDVHYRFGMQETLANHYISKMESQFSDKLKNTKLTNQLP